MHCAFTSWRTSKTRVLRRARWRVNAKIPRRLCSRMKLWPDSRTSRRRLRASAQASLPALSARSWPLKTTAGTAKVKTKQIQCFTPAWQTKPAPFVPQWSDFWSMSAATSKSPSKTPNSDNEPPLARSCGDDRFPVQT